MLQKLKSLNEILKKRSLHVLTLVGTHIVYWFGISISAILFRISSQEKLHEKDGGWMRRPTKSVSPTKMY
jgi:hypothetical protein